MARQSSLLVFWLAFSSGICFVLAFYPIGWAWAAWCAPIGLTLLIQRAELPGKRPRWQLWLGCFICWMLLFQCVRLPHWAGYIGWPILAGYLCSYVFLFVMVSRHFVHRWKFPVIVVAPLIWVGFEYAQAHFCTGISLGMLSHTQVSYPLLIQVADLAGCYTVSFFMVGIVSGLVMGVIRLGERRSYLALGQAILLATTLLYYGWVRLQDADEKIETHDFEVLLVQGSIDTRFPDESEYQEYLDSFTKEYMALSVQGCREPVDLVLWPESMFPALDKYPMPNAELNESQRQELNNGLRSIHFASLLATGAGELRQTPTGVELKRLKDSVPMIVGATSVPLGGERIAYNAGILIDADGVVRARYGKMKLVLFGEFVPLGEVFPWLYNFFPIPPGLKAGKAPVEMKVSEFTFAPNICFESTYPHHIRNHCLKLAGSKMGEGRKPDAIVNLSNDGWFWGSNALDMHFANNVMRAVENRTPVLIAANTGFSGQIDSAGRVIKKGPRRERAILRVQMQTSSQSSIYHSIGDWPAFLCFLLVLSCFFSWIFAHFARGKLQLSNRLRSGHQNSGPESNDEDG